VGAVAGAAVGQPGLGAAAGRAVGGMAPGFNFGPEDDARQSSLKGGFGSAVGNVATDAAVGYGQYKLGEMGVDKLQGAFADPLAAEGASLVADPWAGDASRSPVMGQFGQQVGNPLESGFTGPLPPTSAFSAGAPQAPVDPFTQRGIDQLFPGEIDLGTSGFQSGIDARAATDNLSQFSQNAEVPSWMADAGKMSTLEKAYMLASIGSTAANLYGGHQANQQRQKSRGEGNMFDLAMTDAFGQDRKREGVRSYDDYLRRVG